MANQVRDHFTISATRDYDQAVVAFRDGMSMGNWPLIADSPVRADDLFADGARHVTVHETIDLDDGDARGVVQALTLVRDLTACGIVVDWNVRIGLGHDWQALSHLYPPASVTFGGAADVTSAAGAAGTAGIAGVTSAAGSAGVTSAHGADEAATLEEWASGYVITKCAARRGPGMLQIRDRRWGGLRNVTISSPAYLEAIDRLEYGTPADEIPARILSKLRSTQLVGFAGDLAWWLPYRVRRWAVAFRLV